MVTIGPTMRLELNELVLEPKTKTRDATKSFILKKPDAEGKLATFYDVELSDGRFSVLVNWGPDGPPFPAYLEIHCSFDNIVGVGFSECGKDIEQYTRRGPCGGCFFLVSDITGSSNSVIVENWGHQRKKKKPYHFAVWLQSGKIKRKKFDPQIYNDGVIHDPGSRPPTHKPRKTRSGKKAAP
jgi:hypothetical protein